MFERVGTTFLKDTPLSNGSVTVAAIATGANLTLEGITAIVKNGLSALPLLKDGFLDVMAHIQKRYGSKQSIKQILDELSKKKPRRDTTYEQAKDFIPAQGPKEQIAHAVGGINTQLLSEIDGAATAMLSRTFDREVLQEIIDYYRKVGWSDDKIAKKLKGIIAVSYTHLTLPTNREV